MSRYAVSVLIKDDDDVSLPSLRKSSLASGLISSSVSTYPSRSVCFFRLLAVRGCGLLDTAETLIVVGLAVRSFLVFSGGDDNSFSPSRPCIGLRVPVWSSFLFDGSRGGPKEARVLRSFSCSRGLVRRGFSIFSMRWEDFPGVFLMRIGCGVEVLVASKSVYLVEASVLRLAGIGD